MELTSNPVLLAPLFDALPIGVVVLDQTGRVVVYNECEERLAGRARERVLGRRFFEEVAPCLDVRDLGGRFRAGIARGEISAHVEFTFPFPNVNQPRDVVVRMLAFGASGAPHGLLLVEDISTRKAVERMREVLAQLLVHDMKSPLAAILGNLDFLGDGHAAPAEVSEIVHETRDAGHSLQRMIHNLLDIARLETGVFPINARETDLVALVTDAVRRAQGTARMRGVTVVADAQPGSAWIDAEAMRRVLDNLIDNALRHSPNGQRVIVRAALAGELLTLEVEDRGPGVPAELRERIFEKYAQSTGGPQTSSNYGLGLTFVRMVARAHGSDISIEQASPHGAIFRLQLPVAPPAPPL